MNVVSGRTLAFDEVGAGGARAAAPVVLLPGAGDVRSENRFLVEGLVQAGYRVINADLPGHGESPSQPAYGVKETADALLALIRELGLGSAHVVGTSFAPAAAVWAAGAEPSVVRSIVAISPHVETEETFAGRMMGAVGTILLGGPWAAAVWGGMYRSWYKGRVPDDLGAEVEKMKAMLRRPEGRRAARETLVAHRRGLAEKMAACSCPVLAIFGAADNHFPDRAKEAARVASLLRADTMLIEGAGHYPHVERPDLVLPAIVEFLERADA
ncbi:MAG: alpha/beta fold hydrolase [Candidatus Eisenbacteria bacterium]